jgi:catechol 2,3-dioxygenase-like lactoylglutathione lyase family enzyme
MLDQCHVIAMAPTTDLARARAFYEDVLGFGFIVEDPFACLFEANGTLLRIAAVDEVVQAPYTVLGWVVEDIVAMVEGLAGRGVEFERHDAMVQDEQGIWTAPGGDRIAWFKDPDGNRLSLTEFKVLKEPPVAGW